MCSEKSLEKQSPGSDVFTGKLCLTFEELAPKLHNLCHETKKEHHKRPPLLILQLHKNSIKISHITLSNNIKILN